MTFSTKNKILIVFLLFIVKLLTVIFLNWINGVVYTDHFTNNLLLAYSGGDSYAYIDPIENFIQTGEYYLIEDGRKVYTGRAPYYGSLFYLLRQFFDYYTSLDVLALIQILLESIAGLVMGMIVLKLTNSYRLVFLTLFLFCCSFYQTDYTRRILTESISCSVLIFFIYYFIRLLEKNNIKYYLITGTFLAIAILLKHYFIPFLGLIILPFIYNKQFKINTIKYILAFTLPLIILTGPYTVRNLYRFNKFQPFSEFYGGHQITTAELEARKYMQTIGESIVFWDSESAGCFFTNKNVPCNFTFPTYVFTKHTDLNTLVNARNLYIDYLNNPSPVGEKIIISQFRNLTNDFKKEKPFIAHLGSRVLLTYKFVFQKSSYYIPNAFTGSRHNIINFIKLFQVFLYYLITLGGLAGLVVLLIRNFKIGVIIGSIPVYLLILFPVVLRAIEWRYWTTGHYMLILSLILMIHYLSRNKHSQINQHA